MFWRRRRHPVRSIRSSGLHFIRILKIDDADIFGDENVDSTDSESSTSSSEDETERPASASSTAGATTVGTPPPRSGQPPEPTLSINAASALPSGSSSDQVDIVFDDTSFTSDYPPTPKGVHGLALDPSLLLDSPAGANEAEGTNHPQTIVACVSLSTSSSHRRGASRRGRRITDRKSLAKKRKKRVREVTTDDDVLENLADGDILDFSDEDANDDDGAVPDCGEDDGEGSGDDAEIFQRPLLRRAPRSSGLSRRLLLRAPKFTNSTTGCLLWKEEVDDIYELLPVRYLNRGRFDLVYSTAEHGTSLTTLFLRSLEHRVEMSILIIQTDRGERLGACTTAPWRLPTSEDEDRPSLTSSHRKRSRRKKRLIRYYYGNGECFLFTFEPKFRFHKWSKKNKMFQYASPKGLAMGGKDFALFVGNELREGYTKACDTFDSPPLILGRSRSEGGGKKRRWKRRRKKRGESNPPEYFGIQRLELWAFKDD